LPSLAKFKAFLLSLWYDLSAVKLAEALDDGGCFLSFAASSAPRHRPNTLPLPASARRLDGLLFEAVKQPFT